ncbi:MAG TPA: hypothetical protein DEF72_05065 [Gammaproteobacteria bacterium]|nr:hypothetical protein [Gammaproteobacteria bacterium]HBX26788.1 hypothetical protein [Gammaproteobacteria bacterium]
MPNDNQKWVTIDVTSLVNFGDRVMVGGDEAGKEGLVTGFIGKAREIVVVQFDDRPNQSVTVRKELVTQIKRRESFIENSSSSKKVGRFRSKSKYR